MKNKLLLGLAFGTFITLTACSSSSSSSNSSTTSEAQSSSSIIVDNSSSIEVSSTEETSSIEAVSSTEETSSSEAVSSIEAVTKTAIGSWKGDLKGYSYDDEENFDDLSDITIVLNEDLSGSYSGTSVTWTLMGENTLLAGRYRYYTDDYQVHFGYDEENDTIDVKWENMIEGDYKIGTFTRVA